MSLPLDRSRKCAKCGCSQAALRWFEGYTRDESGKVVHTEAIERRCLDCGYTWNERPLEGEPGILLTEDSEGEG